MASSNRPPIAISAALAGRARPFISADAFARYRRLGFTALWLAAILALHAAMLKGGPDRTLPASLVAVFAGALVAGLIGFAFSAIAGAILLHYADPISAVPLLLACSIATQCMSIARLRRSMDWRGCLPFLAGGIIGIPAGGYLLQTLPPTAFATAFGSFLACYSLYFLLRRPVRALAPRRSVDMLAGLAGGITGGAAAFPGAIPTIWCGLRGLTKEQQRGLIQPFILVMQLATVAYFSRIGIVTSDSLALFAFCVPAVVLGTLAGLALYHRVNDARFRKLTLAFLLVSGAMLVVRSYC
jgi:uncharacterized membrane protein YfcA